MFFVAFIAVVLILVAVVSVVSAYHLPRPPSQAWSDQWNKEGMGLSSELVFLFLVVSVGAAMSIIMYDSFRQLFLDAAWRSGWYLGVVTACTFLVGVYIFWAHKSLAKKQQVDPSQVQRQCLLPYLIYAPYAVIVLVGLILPVLALPIVSVPSDYGVFADVRRDLATNGALVIALAEQKPEVAQEHMAIYNLEYQAAVDTVQRTVGRYLWVVGLFVFFLIVITNTQITRAYDEAAQDIFKLVMWLFLFMAVVICLAGLWQHRVMRDLVAATYERVELTANANDQLNLVVYAKESQLDVREESSARVLRGGFVALLSLVVVTNGFQFLIARITHRSAVDVIFPRSVAGFLKRFLLGGEESQPRA